LALGVINIAEEGSFYFVLCPDCQGNIIIFCRDNSVCMAICGHCQKANAIADDGYDKDDYSTGMWGEVGFN